MARLTRRRLLAGSLPALGVGAAALHAAVPHSTRGTRRPPPPTATDGHNGAHDSGLDDGHASFRDGRDGRPPRQRLRPARDPARLRLGHDAADGEREVAARVGARRDRPRDRGRARRALRGVDVQRAHPRADPALPRGRAAADPLRQRDPHHTHTIHFHGIHPAEMDGVPGVGAGEIAPGGAHGLRVRRPAGRPAPLPLPRAPAGRAHRQGPVRRVHRRPRRRPRGRRRDGHGHERVRHELRPRERGLRGEHDRLRLHGPADRDEA